MAANILKIIEVNPFNTENYNTPIINAIISTINLLFKKHFIE